MWKLCAQEDQAVFEYMKSLIAKKDIRALIVNHANTQGRCIDRWKLYQVMSNFNSETPGNLQVMPACLEIKQVADKDDDSFTYYEYGSRVMTRSPYPTSRFMIN